MKIVHAVPHVDHEASGPSYSVPRLCQALAACGHTVELQCLAARGPIPGVRVTPHRQWPVLKRFAISPDMARALRRSADTADIVHNHSLWSMTNIAAGWMVPGRKAKLVLSPRGTLSPWALQRSRQLKRILWPLQERVLARADLVHATSEAEYRQIRALGHAAPIAIIPNGIDLPAQPSVPTDSGSRMVLYLGRIHPIKGIDSLLRAWRMLQARHHSWHLVIAGEGEREHATHIRQLAASLGVERVEFPGALFAMAKSEAYNRARLFILPSHSENFGMVVAEALAHACPVIASHGTPWSGLPAQGCGWWVTNDVDSLTDTLDQAMGQSMDELARMGESGRQWMARDFSWPSVAQRMQAAYEWTLEGGTQPAWVRTD